MTASIELRDPHDAELWLAGGLCLSRLVDPASDEYVVSAPWIVGALSESGAIPPAGVIADIGHLLTGRSLRSVAPLPQVGAEMRAAISGYEDHVLGRLEADPRMEAVADAIARLPAHRHADAVALFCVHLLTRIAFDASVAIGPGIARRVLLLPAEEIASLGHEAMPEATGVYQSLLHGYRGLSAGARRMGSLIGEPAVFLMENFEALGELTQRLAIEQMIEVSDALSEALPRRLKPRTRIDRGQIPTPLTAEDNYPTGGFSSLSTSGSLENLVVSELIYMEEERDDNIDLFDLRYAEGELLYYTRDESVFVRNRRVLRFALMPDLARVRFKDTGLAWQRSILAFGMIAFCIQRLGEWLEGEGLSFQVVFIAGDPTGEPSQNLDGERALCAILLREWIAREMAEVTTAPSLDQVITVASEDARSAESSLIVLSAQAMDLAPIPDLVAGTVALGAPEPSLSWLHRPEPPRPSEPDTGRQIDLWQSWLRLALELLQEIV